MGGSPRSRKEMSRERGAARRPQVDHSTKGSAVIQVIRKREVILQGSKHRKKPSASALEPPSRTRWLQASSTHQVRMHVRLPACSISNVQCAPSRRLNEPSPCVENGHGRLQQPLAAAQRILQLRQAVVHAQHDLVGHARSAHSMRQHLQCSTVRAAAT